MYRYTFTVVILTRHVVRYCTKTQTLLLKNVEKKIIKLVGKIKELDLTPW